MEKTLVYQRVYSALPGLQQARSISYTLAEKRIGDDVGYRVRVSQTGPRDEREEEGCLLACHPIQAEQLLTYLYENAVPPAHCISVVADVCGTWHREEENGVCPDSAARCG